MAISKEQILKVLSRIKDPELGKDLVSLGMIKQIEAGGGRVRIGIELTTPACPLKDAIRKDIEREMAKVDGDVKVEIDWSARVRESGRQAAQLPGVKNAIAVGAGKGGVGKSTIAVLAALGLQREGAKVGLMDADVYGPSIPKLLGLEDEQPRVRGEALVPIEAHGIKVMSMGFLVDPDKAVIWRGPMVHGAVKQFLEKVDWGELDYLIIDLPPGTGDVPLTLSQTIPMTGAVVVCTPQDVALLDAIKALRMYQMLNVDILGIVENMSYFVAPDTGREYDLFGRGGARKAADRVGVPFLGEIPININIRVAGDAGTPAANFDKTDAITREGIMAFVRNMAAQVSLKNATRAAPLELKIT
ncbi:MAG TPA: Mrp/NBP35 family ATP-binding protein [Phycisphaerae bacterium]|nr:Mrp/NBP35 family ATP-binding protein [Phycisphaerae bacterium]